MIYCTKGTRLWAAWKPSVWNSGLNILIPTLTISQNMLYGGSPSLGNG